jgi:hypothetical protein
MGKSADSIRSCRTDRLPALISEGAALGSQEQGQQHRF